jgi:trinucleotide repeat-containing gene 6 protein
MGQDLWGQSRAQSGKQQTPTTSLSGWPSANGLVSSGSGWSNGTNSVSSASGTPSAAIGPQNAGSSWLLLKNLTAQIDGSTLRTLCMQHGPLHNFHLYLTHGIALVKYGNGQEAKKAQNALNNCVLGNTTILAETTGEQEVESIVRTLSQHSGQSGSGQAPPTNTGPAPGRGSTPATPFTSGYNSLSKSSSSGDTWSALGSGVSLGWPSSGAAVGGSVWGAPDNDQHRTTPLSTFLPPDLLNEGM